MPFLSPDPPGPAAAQQLSEIYAYVVGRFVEEAPSALAMFDREMRYMAVSARWRSDYHLGDRELIGCCHYDIFPEIPEYWKDVHRRCLDGAIERRDEDLFDRADGSRQWLRWEVRPWRTVRAGIGGLIVYSEDITARKEADAAVRASEQRLQFALAASKAGTWTVDLVDNRMRWDARSRELLGITSPEDVAFDGDLRHAHDADRERLLTRLERMMRTPGDDDWDEQFRAERVDGSVQWVHAIGRAVRNECGEVVSISGITLDVTERMNLHLALRERDERLTLALDAASAGAWRWDVGTDVVTADNRIRSRFDIHANREFLRTPSLERMHPNDRARVRATMDSVREPDGPDGWDMEYRLSPSDSETIWIHSVGRVERDGDGRAEAVFGISLDVTERKAKQVELERSHAQLRARAAEVERQATQLRRLASDLTLAEQRTREQLAKTLHDHLQQTLFSALLQVEHAARRTADPTALDRARTELQDAIGAARSLSVELFPPALRQGGLPGALVWLGEWVQRKYGVTVEVTVDTAADPSFEDVRILLFESVRELVFNAVKYARVDRMTLQLALDPSDRLRITVADAGAGFDPTALSAPGAAGGGLGLFGIRERVTLMGGRMEVDSAPGRGARFLLVVPRSASAHASTQETEDVDARVPVAWGDAPAAARARRLRILVADDHAMVRDGLRELFAAHPQLQVVAEAADGLEAIEQCRQHRPDVVIMDLSMPRMDGLEATRRIHAEWPELAIFGLSTQEQTAKLHAVEEAGAVGYFTKGDSVHCMVERMLAVHAEMVQSHE